MFWPHTKISTSRYCFQQSLKTSSMKITTHASYGACGSVGGGG